MTGHEKGVLDSPDSVRSDDTAVQEDISTRAQADGTHVTDHHAGVDKDIARLARHYTSNSQCSQSDLFPAPAEPFLDPQGPEFNPRKWAKAFFQLRSSNVDSVEPRTAGIAFRDLSVHGFGTATDFLLSRCH